MHRRGIGLDVEGRGRDCRTGQQFRRDHLFGNGRSVPGRSFELSVRGVPLWRRGTKLRTLGISFDNAYKDEVENTIQPLLAAHGSELPVFICTDPASDANRQRRCWFGPMIGEIGTIWARANGWRWSANIVSLI